MDKILLINKDKGFTSRDIVNIVSIKYKTKKVGHFGTLDPLATGLLVIGIGSLTKLDNFNLFDTKEYVCDCLVGLKTNTYDVTGNTLEVSDKKVNYDDLVNTLLSFKKTYLQEVPIYSAVKVNGRKLYDYARNKEDVVLPKKEVTIFDISLLDLYEKDGEQHFKFKALVSKGTYIRSLVNDISNSLNIPMCMNDLIRTKQGNFSLDDASTLEEFNANKERLLDISDILDLEEVVIPSSLEKYILSGNIISFQSLKDYVLFVLDDKTRVVLYKKIDDKKMKPCFFFKN